MREVADRAGVAMSSVSRVLSGHPDVSDAMRERVLSAVDALGYTPDLLAQGLRRRQTMSVGFVVGDISNPLIAQVVKGAETVLRASGYSMLLTNSLFDAVMDRQNVVLLEQRRVDGLILLLVREDYEPTLDVLRAAELPLVALERTLPPDLGASSVLSDHRAGIGAAVDRLLDLGHRRIGLVVGQPVWPTRERRAALVSAYARRGLPPTYEVRDGAYSTEHGERAARELLDGDDPPTAIIAGGNQIMLGALRLITQRRLRLGRDLSFVGCDNLDLAGIFDPPLALVTRDGEALGRSAAELLLRRIGGVAAEPETVELPTEYVERASVGPPSSRVGPV